jgi:peroxiredoxin Q/BCP
MGKLKVGDKAPDFQGKDQLGNDITLSAFLGKKVVLYFYPKDNTPGCTAEACNLRDNYQELLNAGLVVVGVSADSQKSHQNFINKHSLPFPLISDPEKEIINKYGVWGEKSLYGKIFNGINRVTYIITEEGVIEKIIEKVKTKDHTRQIFDELSH